MKPEQEVNLKDELVLFRSFCDQESNYVRVESAGPDIILLSPLNYSITDVDRARIGFLALVHGNETVGLPMLNSLISAILCGDVKIYSDTYFALGNVAAAEEDKRFIEKDLNRCFGLSLYESAEDRRAREIEKFMLNKIDILLDLHQTVYASETPFFIFQYSSPKCFEYLSLMNVKLPTVLQFDNIGEDQGLSTDEYLRSRGGFGTALELGQVGYIERFFREGTECCLRLIESVKHIQNIRNDVFNIFLYNLDCDFFEISGRQYAQDDNTVLDSKYFNFSKFNVGDVIATSANQVIKSELSGRMLFPKLNQSLNKGQNLFFICNELSLEKLNLLKRVPPTIEL